MNPVKTDEAPDKQADLPAKSKGGCQQTALAFAGFFLFLVVAILLVSAKSGALLVGGILISAVAGFVLITRTELKGLGIGLLLGVFLIGGAFLLLSSYCGPNGMR